MSKNINKLIIKYEDLENKENETFLEILNFTDNLLKKNNKVDQKKFGSAIETTKFDILKIVLVIMINKTNTLDCFKNKKIINKFYCMEEFHSSFLTDFTLLITRFILGFGVLDSDCTVLLLSG